MYNEMTTVKEQHADGEKGCTIRHPMHGKAVVGLLGAVLKQGAFGYVLAGRGLCGGAYGRWLRRRRVATV